MPLSAARAVLARRCLLRSPALRFGHGDNALLSLGRALEAGASWSKTPSGSAFSLQPASLHSSGRWAVSFTSETLAEQNEKHEHSVREAMHARAGEVMVGESDIAARGRHPARRQRRKIRKSSEIPSKRRGDAPWWAFLMYALERTSGRHFSPVNPSLRVDPFDNRSNSKVSIPAVLARYILSRPPTEGSPGIQQAVPAKGWDFLAPHDREYLDSRGYKSKDLESWALAIVARDDGSAVREVFRPRQDGQKPAPLFLLLFILRRRYFDAKTLRCLLTEAWEHFERPHLDSIDPENNSSFGERTRFTIFAHLLRHARQVWPQAIENITQILSTYLRRINLDTEKERNPTAKLTRLNTVCNRALVLLAEPASYRRFVSSVHLETAQFDLLDAMASHTPPLTISQNGYEAVIRILLSRPKTARERDWALMQTRSWPPWKEDRTGIDETKEISYGFSRSVVAIHRMMEAGYGSFYWRRLAKLYAGWDVDGSPTVQTRTSLHPSKDIAEPSSLWEARIRTTRTIREAWACFLSYKDSDCPPSREVYMAMITKLSLGLKLAAKVAVASDSSTQEQHIWRGREDPEDLYPGDTIEPLPEPTYPGDITYIPNNPPSALGLFKEMLEMGIKINNETVATLVRRARTIEEGMDFLRIAGPPYSDYVRVLASADEVYPSDLASVPLSVFAGFVFLLCRIPRSPLRLVRARKGSTRPQPHQERSLCRESPLSHTMRLLQLRRYGGGDLWAALLLSLSDDESSLAFHEGAGIRDEQAFTKLCAVGRALSAMRSCGLDPDTSSLQAISTAMETAALARIRLRESDQFEQTSNSWRTTVDRLSDMFSGDAWMQSLTGEGQTDGAQTAIRASRFLRVLFQRVVSGGPPDTIPPHQPLHTDISPIPRLLAVPNAAELHAYVRALGVLGDHEGIWSLVQWMADHNAALSMQVAEESSGKRRWSTLLTAIRIFLECPERDVKVAMAGQPAELVPAAQDLVALVRDKIESVPAWEGLWPDEDTVMHYILRS